MTDDSEIADRSGLVESSDDLQKKLGAIRSDVADQTVDQPDSATEAEIENEQVEQLKALTPTQRGDLYFTVYRQQVAHDNERNERRIEQFEDLLRQKDTDLAAVYSRVEALAEKAGRFHERANWHKSTDVGCALAVLLSSAMIAVASYYRDDKSWATQLLWAGISVAIVAGTFNLWLALRAKGPK